MAHDLLSLGRLAAGSLSLRELLLDGLHGQEGHALVLGLDVTLHECLRVDTGRQKALLRHHHYLLLLLSLFDKIVVTSFSLGACIPALNILLELLLVHNVLICYDIAVGAHLGPSLIFTAAFARGAPFRVPAVNRALLRAPSR